MIKRISKISKLFIAIIIILFAIGQIPYGYMYCGMMKSSVDSKMQQHCLVMQSNNVPGIQCRQSSSSSSMKLVVKATTDNSDQSSLQHLSAGNAIIATVGYCERSLVSLRFFTTELFHPPPDIVTLNGNLRI